MGGSNAKFVAIRRFIFKNEGPLPIFIKKMRIDHGECSAGGF
jgi:hypothetical protein